MRTSFPMGRSLRVLALIPSAMCLLPLCAWSASPQEVARAIFPKTVLISTQDQSGQPLALGSGFVLEQRQIVTNAHVIEGATKGYVKIIGDQREYRISGVSAIDERRDLAILFVDGLSIDGAELSTTVPEVGDTVFAIGNPRGSEGTSSQGVVNGIRSHSDLTLLQITAPISPGSSGGPIANQDGKIVGVAVATFRGGQNLNFAIPASYIHELQQKLGSPVRLSGRTAAAGSTSFFSELEGKKPAEAIDVGAFRWAGGPQCSLAYGVFDVALRNKLDTPVKNVQVLVVLRDRNGNRIGSALVGYSGQIPAQLAKRVNGVVDSSVQALSTDVCPTNRYMYSFEPVRLPEYRVLGFELVK